jgi:coenzyme F420 hydrogenase subunit beta
MSENPLETLTSVVGGGTCTGCGACSALFGPEAVQMRAVPTGVEADISGRIPLPTAWDGSVDFCPGRGIDYPDLYHKHYGALPENWLYGVTQAVRTGHATDESVRRGGASGGVTTAVLCHLLETRRIAAAIVVRQGVPTPDQASPVFARTRPEILASAQSVYIPVAVLDALRLARPGETYAMTCTPEQSAALRVLQKRGFGPALQVKYVLGPYTGTALQPGAIRCLLRSQGVKDSDAITSLKWRAGEWPGYLEIMTASGRTVRSKKVYYNFLIPFFVTQTSLQSMDFANEFADLAVGDAWSPKFENLGGGYSVVVTRTPEMEAIIKEMISLGLLTLQDEDPKKAGEMHGHMIDFKKRGGYLRNRARRATGMAAPDFGVRPFPLPASRVLVECIISSLFLFCRNPLARRALEHIPESVIGPIFNKLRLLWKAASKPTKRKGLGNMVMQTHIPEWKQAN